MDCAMGSFLFLPICPHSGVRDGYRLAFDVCSKASTRDRRVQAALSRCPAGRQSKVRWRHSDPEQPPGGGRHRQFESGLLQGRVVRTPMETVDEGSFRCESASDHRAALQPCTPRRACRCHQKSSCVPLSSKYATSIALEAPARLSCWSFIGPTTRHQ